MARTNQVPAQSNPNPNDGWEDGALSDQEANSQETVQPKVAPAAADTQAAAGAGVPESEESSDDSYPSDINKCLELLRELEKLPERTFNQEQFKAAKINPLKRHIHDIQQGLKPIHNDSHSHGLRIASQTEINRNQRWEALARHDVHARELLNAYKNLRKENEQLKEELSKKKK